jgi:AraC family transcriptional regulator
MFPFITGVSLSEYIRRRRLTLAAFELQTSDAKVIDIAMKYGYEAPEAFTRAFKELHGLTPVSARETGKGLKTYPRMSFQISVKGDIEMDYRIEEREAFDVFGVYAEISRNQEKAFHEVPAFFRKCDEDKVPDEINALLGRFHDNHTISALYDHNEASFKYMLCNYLPKGLAIPEKFTVLKVPALTWAVFNCPDGGIQKLWSRVWMEWFPTSEYERAPGPEFEMYYGLARHENIHGEIWVPVKKK